MTKIIINVRFHYSRTINNLSTSYPLVYALNYGFVSLTPLYKGLKGCMLNVETVPVSCRNRVRKDAKTGKYKMKTREISGGEMMLSSPMVGPRPNPGVGPRP